MNLNTRSSKTKEKLYLNINQGWKLILSKITVFKYSTRETKSKTKFQCETSYYKHKQ